jgi:hypothetical protein
MQDSRRRSERVIISQLIDMSLMRERDLVARTININEGGILCESEHTVEPLSPVYLMLRIPTQGAEYLLRTEGVVVHSRMEGGRCMFGIAFSPLLEKDRKAVREYLALVPAEA